MSVMQVYEVQDLVMQDNAVAGSERSGYAVVGLSCSSDAQLWSGNVAHSVLTG